MRVLVDELLDGAAVCRSEFESPEVDGEILVREFSPDVRVGDMIRVRIVEAEDYDLIGRQMLD